MTTPEAQPTGAEVAKKPLTAREKLKANMTPVHDPLIGQVIGGHYEVLECIGRGGMSVVYKCRHQLINQFRAVKVLLPHRDSEGDCLLRFQLEATAASRLDNRHIVKVHDFVAPEDSAPYMVMDYAEGQGLGDEIDRLGRIPVKRSLAIFVQILDAIGHTHARGVIHRDLKPDNILLVDDEIEGADYVKLIDFGIAKLTAADKLQPQGLTPTGEVFGSPQYMSPEQCAGLNLDVRSEIYSMGCILYEMLSGKAPLLGKSVLETLNMQAHTPPTPLSKLVIDPPLKVQPELDHILMRCLAKRPEDRFQTTDELRKAITKLPSFDRRSRMQTRMSPEIGGRQLGIAGLALALTFCLGFGTARLIPGDNLSPGGQGETKPPTGATAEWEGLYVAGQKAIDQGDLPLASTKLEEALTKANAFNDGQRRAAATGIDLVALDAVKQLKNIGPNDLTSLVKLSQNYPDNPWETRVGAVADVLRGEAKDADSEKAIYKSTVALLEDERKGSLIALTPVLDLAAAKLDKSVALSEHDKMQLALLVAGAMEEQGYFARSEKLLKTQAPLLKKLGGSDWLSGKFHLLSGRLALDLHNIGRAKEETQKAQLIFDENIAENNTELIDAALLASDIMLADGNLDESVRLAKQAIVLTENAHPSERVEELKDRLLLRAALLDPGKFLKPALSQCQNELELEEVQAPKEVPHLITVLTMSYYLGKLQDNQAAGGRSKLWRAIALAMATGRMAQASTLMAPLLTDYNTPLTQKDRLKVALNRLAIDESLSAAGNNSRSAFLQDYAAIAEAYEDFSLGPARNIKLAHSYLEKALGLLEENDKNQDPLTAAHICYAQARYLHDNNKVAPFLMDALLKKTKSACDSVTHYWPDKERDQDAQELTKKVTEMLEQTRRLQPR